MSSLSHPAGITTLHRLSPEAWPALEKSLETMTRERPVTLILPCHVRELGTEALAGMVQELAGAAWVKRIVIGLDGAESHELAIARECFAALPQETCACSGPGLRRC